VTADPDTAEFLLEDCAPAENRQQVQRDWAPLAVQQRLAKGEVQVLAGGVADEWVTQMLRQGDAKVFKKYSQMKLQMKREALEKINRQANEARGFDTAKLQ